MEPVEIANNFKKFNETNDVSGYMLESVQICNDLFTEFKKEMIGEPPFKIKGTTVDNINSLITLLDTKYKQTVKLINVNRSIDFPYLSPYGFVFYMSSFLPAIMENYQKTNLLDGRDHAA